MRISAFQLHLQIAHQKNRERLSAFVGETEGHGAAVAYRGSDGMRMILSFADGDVRDELHVEARRRGIISMCFDDAGIAS